MEKEEKNVEGSERMNMLIGEERDMIERRILKEVQERKRME